MFTSSNLLNNKDKTVGVAVETDADQLLHIAARLSLVPQPALAALVDSGTGAKRFRDALVAAPHETKA